MKKIFFVISIFCLFTGFSFGQTEDIIGYDTIITTREIVDLPTIFENKTNCEVSILIYDRNREKYSKDAIKLTSKSQIKIVDKFEPTIYITKVYFENDKYGKLYFRKYFAPGEKMKITKREITKAIKNKKALAKEKKELKEKFKSKVVPIKIEERIDIFPVYEEVEEYEDNG
jgi:hypothetical protein